MHSPTIRRFGERDELAELTGTITDEVGAELARRGPNGHGGHGGRDAGDDAAVAASISGAFDLEIEVGGKTYIVTVHSPRQPGEPYVLEFTYSDVRYSMTVRWPEEDGDPYEIRLRRSVDGGEPETLLGVEYTDTERWAAELSLPTMTFGTVTIRKLALSIERRPNPDDDPPIVAAAPTPRQMSTANITVGGDGRRS
ncbi:hypothetical protein [Dactylosporangium sp. NPDC051541]|uniref:hypothetical protein n=1 Tax=Dactylosporangium sp. NPDC051541 TaxID=3363977 RepID=UPI0037AD1AA6